MKQCTTQHVVDPHRILTYLAELDSLYKAGNLAAYEQTWQEVCQQVQHLFPGFTLAHAELYTVSCERQAHGGMRHVFVPSERNAQ